MKKFELPEGQLLTLPNLVSATGFLLVMDGIRRGVDTPEGQGEIFVGRVADLADGYIARKTGQSSDLGATIDATLDKVGGFAILYSTYDKGYMPKPLAMGIAAQNVINMGATYAFKAKNPGGELASSVDGKRATFAQNLTVGSYALSGLLLEESKAEALTEDSRLRLERASQVSRVAAQTAAAGFLYYGPKATYGYLARI